MLKEKTALSNWVLIVWGIATLAAIIFVIILVAGNLSIESKLVNIKIGGKNLYALWQKNQDIDDEIDTIKTEKISAQTRTTKDIIKKIRILANSTFKQQMIERGITGNPYDNPIYKAYTHMFFFVSDYAQDRTLSRIFNDFDPLIKEGIYSYEYYQTDFEKFIHNPILNDLNTVREDIQKEWIDIRDEDTGIIITSSENYEYMESIKLEMYQLIQSVYIECFKINLEKSAKIFEKEKELEEFIELLE